MTEVTTRKLREFAALWVIVILALSLWIDQKLHWPALSAALLLGLLGMVRPYWLLFPYRLWMKVAEFIAFINTYIILGLIFCFILTPMSGIARALKMKLLDKDIDKNCKSYLKYRNTLLEYHDMEPPY